MARSEKDPTEPIRLAASRFSGVDEGTSCTQSSFKTGRKAFLYIGPQGGRFKAMFKLQESMSEAAKLAKKDPEHFEVGSTSWVTARFSAEDPMPKKLWKAWLDESYELSRPGSAAGKQAGKKKVARKKTTKKAKTGGRAATRAAGRLRSSSCRHPRGAASDFDEGDSDPSSAEDYRLELRRRSE